VAIVVPTPNTVITSAWGKSVADAINAAPGTELAYAQITTNVTVNTGSEGSANLVVSAPAITLDGTTAILVEFYAGAVIPAALANAVVHVYLSDTPGVSLGRLAMVSNPAAANLYVPVYAARRLTPAAGNKTYQVGAYQSGGNGSIAAGPGGTGAWGPAFIRITRV
jgi:hypothetical protein